MIQPREKIWFLTVYRWKKCPFFVECKNSQGKTGSCSVPVLGNGILWKRYYNPHLKKYDIDIASWFMSRGFTKFYKLNSYFFCHKGIPWGVVGERSRWHLNACWFVVNAGGMFYLVIDGFIGYVLPLSEKYGRIHWNFKFFRCTVLRISLIHRPKAQFWKQAWNNRCKSTI
jgi:hypothetical protein